MDWRVAGKWTVGVLMAGLVLAGLGREVYRSDWYMREQRPAEYWRRRVEEEKALIRAIEMDMRLEIHERRRSAVEADLAKEQRAILYRDLPREEREEAARFDAEVDAESARLRKDLSEAEMEDLRKELGAAKSRLKDAEERLAVWAPAKR